MNREIKYRYDLLNKTNNKIGELECIDGTINMQSNANIKYSGQFNIKENESKDVDYLNDRIRPVFIENGIEHNLGTFLISSPERKKNNLGIYRSITGYDISQILLEDCFTETYFIKQGTRYKDVITRIVNSSGIHSVNIISSNDTFSRDRELEIGKSKLETINELLKEINYTSIFVDKYGNISAKPYILPNLREIQHSFIVGETANIINSDIIDNLDLFNIPNVFIAVVSNPEKPPLISKYVNDKPTNELSTVSRGRNIVLVENLNDITDKQVADGYIKRVAYEKTNVFRTVTFDTLNKANHGYADCVYLKDEKLGLDGKYIESEWQMRLKVGSTMSHKIQKIELLL